MWRWGLWIKGRAFQLVTMLNGDKTIKFFKIRNKKNIFTTDIFIQHWFRFQILWNNEKKKDAGHIKYGLVTRADNNSVASIENSDKATHMWTEVKENHNIKFMS